MSYSKNYICKFMQTSSWHHKLFYFHLSFLYLESVESKGKITQIWIAFHSFWRVVIWWKNKNLIKNSGHNFKDSLPQNVSQMIMKTILIHARMVINFTMKKNIPFWVWRKVNVNRENNMIRISQLRESYRTKGQQK